MANEPILVATQIPWNSVITACSGITGAFGGAFLANRFAEKRWLKQIEHEREKEERALMRSKGEEAYKLMRRWEKELFFFNSSRIAYLQGNIQKNEMDKNINDKVNASTHGELKVLIDLYFDQLNEKLEAIHKQVLKVNTIFFESHNQIPAYPQSQVMAQECAVYERLVEQFFRSLKNKVKNI